MRGFFFNSLRMRCTFVPGLDPGLPGATKLAKRGPKKDTVSNLVGNLTYPAPSTFPKQIERAVAHWSVSRTQWKEFRVFVASSTKMTPVLGSKVRPNNAPAPAGEPLLSSST